jgi:hypothetical protein
LGNQSGRAFRWRGGSTWAAAEREVVVVDDGGATVRDCRCKELRMPTGKKASTRPISKPNRRAAVKTRERVDCVVMVVLGLVCGWRCWLDETTRGKRQRQKRKLFCCLGVL